MEQKIKALLEIFSKEGYDREEIHIQYDDLLEKFILNYDESLIPLMKELIEAEKYFWYA
jgi:hypothetical protein